MSEDNGNSGGGCLGVGAGSVCGCILSLALNHSGAWAILHFLLGWVYVLYAAIWRTREIVPALRAMFGA